MTAHNDLDRQLTDFLREGPEELPYESFDAVRDRTERTGQRVFIGPWRLPEMNKIVTIALGAAAAVVLALLIGSQLLESPGGLGGPGTEPTPSPEATASPAPSAAQPTSTPEAGLPEGPFELAGDGASDRAPRITVAIPASGWSYAAEPGALIKGDEVNNLPESAILVYSEAAGTAFYVYGDPCRWQSTKPATPATTVEEIAAALAAQPSREASEPVDVSVGGYAGKAVTLHVPDDVNINDCEGPEYASFGTEADDLARYHQGPGQIDELWVIDVDGAVVIFDAMYRPDTSAELIAEMRSIAESATFEAP
jgi:hypothetical protein